MTEAAPSTPFISVSSATARVSYWTVVLAQLRKNTSAMVAWRLLKALVFIAVFAPILAFNVPIVAAKGWRISFPLLSSLFDRTLFGNGVDVFFNLVMLVAPAWMLGRALARVVTRMRRNDSVAIGDAVVVLGFGLLFLLSLVSALLGRTDIRIGVGASAMTLVASLLSSSWGARAAPLSAAAARRIAALAFLVALVAIFYRPPESSAWRVWRGPGAEPISWGLFPPVPYHPDNVGESAQAALDRARFNRPSASNWLGCDPNGRDVVARIAFGARISMSIGIVSVCIALLIGLFLGSLAGYYGGKADLLISRFIEVMICFPVMFLLLTIIAVFESRSIFLIMAAIGVVGWTGIARLVRGEFIRQRGLDYVTAARALGIRPRRIIFRHVLPNCLGPVLVSATFGIAGAILLESGLAFLGLGDTTAASWGQMLTVGRTSQEWHLIFVPGFAIFFVVTVFNLLGEGLRDALDPKLRR